jgi:hypothetical protein
MAQEGSATNRYWAYSNLLHSPVVSLYLAALEHDAIKLTKPLLLLARYGNIPSKTEGNLFKIIAPALYFFSDTIRNPNNRNQYHTVDPQYYELRPFLHVEKEMTDLSDPFIRGALVSLCCAFRITPDEEKAIIQGALEKEAMVIRRTVFARPEVNWDGLFLGGDVLRGLWPDEFAVSDVQFAIGRMVGRLKQRTFYPTMSRKLVTTRLSRWLEERDHLCVDPPGEYTIACVENIYILSGSIMEGPAQIKQRWYTNVITPRVYAVGGESAYFHAKDLKDIWNICWNAFAPTEKFKRVDLDRIRRRSAAYSFAMYDLSTFTSNMETHRDFVLSFAEQFEDTEVEIADGRHGFMKKKVKHILQEYANTLCQRVEWYTHEEGLASPMYTDFHCVAGLLGIIGNIASCGLAHGLFLRTLVDSISECGVAGDDAIFVYLLVEGWGDKTELLREALGILAQEKVFDWKFGEAVYLKRGVKAGFPDDRLALKEYIQFPSVLHRSPHDLHRFAEGVSAQNDHQYLKRRFVSSLGATFRSAARVGKESLPALTRFLQAEYTHLGLPWTGHSPGCPTSCMPFWCKDQFLPAIEDLGYEHFVAALVARSYVDGWSFDCTELPSNPLWFSLEDVSEFWAFPSQELKYLDRLGVLTKNIVREEKGGFAGSRAMEEYLGRLESKSRPRVVYRYLVSNRVPLSYIHPHLLMVYGCPNGESCIVMTYTFI